MHNNLYHAVIMNLMAVYQYCDSGLMFQRLHGIQVQELFFLNYFLDTGITVGPIGQVGKTEGRFFGTSAQLIGWTFAATVMTWATTVMIRLSFSKQI